MVTVFRDCLLLRNQEIVRDDLWVENGVIIDPEPLFFDSKRCFDVEVFCHNQLISPGFIDLQINGAFGKDFSCDIVDEKSAKDALDIVGKGLLAHGVTSYCPTVVTSSPSMYEQVLPYMGPQSFLDRATVLGAHVEGPFISVEKKGAHKEDLVRVDVNNLVKVYGEENVKHNLRIITLAPELEPEGNMVEFLVNKGITVSLGHTMATLEMAEVAVKRGARLLTHMFNAMTAFHHRDPGLIGLLTSERLHGQSVYYGLIVDGIHTHPATIRLAYRTNFESLCLVTDAIAAMGLEDGTYKLGKQVVKVEGKKAVVEGTETLCGAIGTMIGCIRRLRKNARCSTPEALLTATLHPAKAIGIEGSKGTLGFGADADLVILDPDELEVNATFVKGKLVYEREGAVRPVFKRR